MIELVGQTHELQLVSIFQPYIVAHLDYAGMLSPTGGIEPVEPFDPSLIVAALPTPEFRNVVSVKWDIATDIRNLLEISLTSAREVRSLLNEEITRRK